MNTEGEATDGEYTSAQTVYSTYFTTKSAMDESLSDFQEPKILSGPRNTVSKAKPSKPKKAPKKIRGQKDIRTAIKSRQKELESYAKDFDTVCKHAGLDVDSEQLQLAIALSKSLQPNNSALGKNLESSQSLSTQDRVGKIRTTLLEYGFKVPDIKITATGSRRLKRRKKYKLMETASEVKKEIISEKYSQVLFENIHHTKDRLSDSDFTHIPLYNLATNATYNKLKTIDTFYVDGLLEKSNSTGSLLRDWSEIPGRPVSPMLSKPINMNLSEIECSQDELDILLSGSLKNCKNIIKNKKEDINSSVNKLSDMPSGKSDCVCSIDEVNPISKKIFCNKTFIGEDSNTSTKRANHYRSCSPDIFDDEPASVINNDKSKFSQETPKDILTSQKVPVVFHSNDVMDLTQCNQDVECSRLKENQSILLNTKSQISEEETNIKFYDVKEITDCVEVHYLDINYHANRTPNSQMSKNITKRKSNDFMEITSCVSSPINYVQTKVEIDLTQFSENITAIPDSNKTTNINNETNIKNDLGLVYHNDTDENVSKIDFKTGTPGNIDLRKSQSMIRIDTIEDEVHDECFDLTQSSNTSEELPFVSLKANPKKQSADDTIIIDPDEYECFIREKCKQRVSREKKLTQDNNKVLDASQSIAVDEITHISFHDNQSDIDLHLTQNVKREEVEVLDLTQEEVCTPRRNIETSQDNINFFEEYVHNHSDNNDELASETKIFYKDTNSEENRSPGVILAQSPFYGTKRSKDTESNEIDLTQSPIYAGKTFKDNESNNIDLTQNSDPESKQHSQDLQIKDKYVDFKEESEHSTNTDEEDTIEMEVVKTSQRYSSLGKKGDISIDYDELCDNLADENDCSKQCASVSKSSTENSQNKSKDVSNCSQASEVFVISDNELDYSMHQSKLERPADNFLFGGISIMDGLSALSSYRKSTNKNNSGEDNRNVINEVDNITDKTPVKHKRVNELITPQKPSGSGLNTVLTPSNSEYVIKTNDVTPKPNYEEMTLEEIHKELDKFGVKPFKRKRAIQLLSHIYNQTHPIIEPYSEESPCKIQKTHAHESPRKGHHRKITPRKILSPKKTLKTSIKRDGKEKETKGQPKKSNEEEIILDAIQIGNQNYDVNDVPVIKEVECSPDDWVFQKREKAKVHSCRVPLHIAFHNYVSSRRGLREAILCYQPINIDDIHKDLVAYGHRYDPKDLLKFMDKKCITVKTTDNDTRNQKR